MISDTVEKWAQEFEKVVQANSYKPYNPLSDLEQQNDKS